MVYLQKNPIVSTTFNSERWNALASAINPEKEIKGIQIRKEEIKPS